MFIEERCVLPTLAESSREGIHVRGVGMGQERKHCTEEGSNLQPPGSKPGTLSIELSVLKIREPVYQGDRINFNRRLKKGKGVGYNKCVSN